MPSDTGHAPFLLLSIRAEDEAADHVADVGLETFDLVLQRVDRLRRRVLHDGAGEPPPPSLRRRHERPEAPGQVRGPRAPEPPGERHEGADLDLGLGHPLGRDLGQRGHGVPLDVRRRLELKVEQPGGDGAWEGATDDGPQGRAQGGGRVSSRIQGLARCRAVPDGAREPAEPVGREPPPAGVGAVAGVPSVGVEPVPGGPPEDLQRAQVEAPEQLVHARDVVVGPPVGHRLLHASEQHAGQARAQVGRRTPRPERGHAGGLGGLQRVEARTRPGEGREGLRRLNEVRVRLADDPDRAQGGAQRGRFRPVPGEDTVAEPSAADPEAVLHDPAIQVAAAVDEDHPPRLGRKGQADGVRLGEPEPRDLEQPVGELGHGLPHDGLALPLVEEGVEGVEGCPNKDRLGPYATEAEAARAVEKAAERTAAWDNDPGVKEFVAFMKEWYPEGNPIDGSAQTGYQSAKILEIILKNCGDNLTRANLLKQATTFKKVSLPLLLPGITVSISPDDYSTFDTFRLAKFDGKTWVFFGENLSVAAK